MVTKAEVTEILGEYFSLDLSKAKVGLDGTVTVHDDVQLLNYTHKAWEAIPITFKYVSGSFHLDDNTLKTLRGCPKEVGMNFDCSRNHLTTLEFGPETVGWNYYCDHNQLSDLQGAPTSIRNNFNCIGNPLKSLEGFPKEVGNAVWLSYDPNLPLLRTLAAKFVFLEPNVDEIGNNHGLNDVQKILAKYAGQGKRAMFDCQKDLEDAGFPAHARW